MHYSKAEASPVGIATTLYDKLGPCGISHFLWQSPPRKMKFQDLEDISMMEILELLKSTVKPLKKKTILNYSSPNAPAEIHISIDSEDYKKCSLNRKKIQHLH